MLEAIDDGLRFLFRGLLLPLHLRHEAAEVRSRHEAIVGVAIEQGPYLRRRLRQGHLEAPPAAEANSVSLFRHGQGSLLFSSLLFSLTEFSNKTQETGSACALYRYDY